MTSIVITVFALGLMYFCCIRPMRRGHSARRSCCSATDSDAGGRSDELARLSRDVEALRKPTDTAGPARTGLSDRSRLPRRRHRNWLYEAG